MTARLLRICLLFAGPASAWCHSPLSISVVMSSLSNRMKSHRSRLGLVIVLWMICLPVGGLGAGRSVASGTLEIKADPGTTILLDGLPIGTSDDAGGLTISNIPPGLHTVVAQEEGGDSIFREVEVEAGDQALEISLTRSPAPGRSINASLPDPFSRRSSPRISVFVVAILVAIGVGALWLGRRRMEPLDEIPHKPEGPHVVMPRKRRDRRRFPRFYEDLRRRETALENLEERGSDRPRLKVIELPAADRRSGEDDG